MIVKGDTIYSEPGKVLRRKADGFIGGTEIVLGYTYYIDGQKLDTPKLEKPDDYEDVTSPEDIEYGELVDSLIRKEYSLSDELAIHRQRETKPEQFKRYFDFCENCKRRAKEELGF